MSQDGRSPSPTKSYAVQSPVSPGGSSGFSSRRSSQDGFHLEELSLVQQQLSEINNRYGLLGVRLTDRQTELDNIREELRKHLDNLKTLSQFLDKVREKRIFFCHIFQFFFSISGITVSFIFYLITLFPSFYPLKLIKSFETPKIIHFPPFSPYFLEIICKNCHFL